MLAARKRTKHQVCDSYLQNLLARPDISYLEAGFAERLRSHFDLLPTRYALDISIDSLDVLNHMQLLEEARRDKSAVFFHVRTVEVLVHSHSRQDMRSSSGGMDTGAAMDSEAVHSTSVKIPEGPDKPAQAVHRLPSPAFGSSPSLQALALDAAEAENVPTEARQFHEITVVSADQPKLLSRLSEVMGDLGLNICEAHAFNTTDGFSLDIFVVDGWSSEAKEGLEQSLSARFAQLTMGSQSGKGGGAGGAESPRASKASHINDQIARANYPLITNASLEYAGMEDWEVDINQLDIESKIAQGSFGTLYKGYYCGQEVAVKILRDVQEDPQQYQEFLQEVSIMRKVRHKNVVQFIGACTRQPNFCILFEYMAGGSVYDYVRRCGVFALPKVLNMLHQIARGMDYLHQRGIIHRDLKAANLLLDENLHVKIADFGVARLIEKDTIMTAETGTYRWMAPEVIEHKDYNQKADVFSFGIVVWELLTGQVPYAECTALQAAVGVVQKSLRPTMPPSCPVGLTQLVQACWHSNPECRPSFKDLVPVLEAMARDAKLAEAVPAGGDVAAAPAAGAAPAQNAPKPSFFARLRPGGK